ncbi:MAG: DegV family protein [Microgenomates group bacterium]
MSQERKVAVVTDSGTSIRPEDKLAKEYGVTIVPLEIKFYENGEFVSYADLDITPQEFYDRMRSSEKIPQTSGAVPGRICEIYNKLAKKTDSIISVHITSKHSVAWESAVLGKNLAEEDNPELLIEVIDSGQISIGTWWPAQIAAGLSQLGAGIEEIKEEVLEAITKIELRAVLESFENLKKGGRAREIAKAYFASLLKIYPVIGLKRGKLTMFDRERTASKARQRMVEMVGDAGELVRVALLHTNALELAKGVKESLAKIYKKPIPIFEAGTVLGVHAGEGAVGVAFQKS